MKVICKWIRDCTHYPCPDDFKGTDLCEREATATDMLAALKELGPDCWKCANPKNPACDSFTCEDCIWSTQLEDNFTPKQEAK